MLPADPCEPIAKLQQLVVVLTRRAEQRVAERLVALDVEERKPVRVRAAEPDTLDAQSADQVGTARRFATSIELHAGETDANFMDHPGRDRLDDAAGEVLEPVVMVRPKARQILRCEPALAAECVAPEHDRAVLPAVIDAKCALVRLKALSACVEIVVERPAHAHAHPHGVIDIR